MDIGYIKELIELLKETDIHEFIYEKDGQKIKIKRLASGEAKVVRSVVVEENPPLVNRHDDEDRNAVVVRAPIVGTFYRSPTPDSAPFVEVGSKVKKGQILCIIEAMKLMNEIESEVDGVIKKIFVENGHPVEYGEPMFLIMQD
ncbi:MAG: acetyl-CoA carboxylase biotin carboxyl carrier protein [Candidatus Magnetoovum sp. WYHC-5]|nr:acetyl-CoA carboxylase biotin carboxyl carrier protein [Candidatus Magnetoovum sp. WYHC-5]